MATLNAKSEAIQKLHSVIEMVMENLTDIEIPEGLTVEITLHKDKQTARLFDAYGYDIFNPYD